MNDADLNSLEADIKALGGSWSADYVVSFRARLLAAVDELRARRAEVSLLRSSLGAEISDLRRQLLTALDPAAVEGD